MKNKNSSQASRALVLLTLLALTQASLAAITTLQDLEGVITIFRDKTEKIADIVSKHEKILIAFGDKELLNKRDYQHYANMAKAAEKATSKLNQKISFGFYDNTVSTSENKAYNIGLLSVPKVIYFTEYGKKFRLYKGGRSAAQIFAWLKRNSRKVGIEEYYLRQLYQFDKRVFMVYYGDEKNEIFDHLKNEYWLKKTSLPIYRLTNFTLLKKYGCEASNTTEKNWVLAIAKNGTYSPCLNLFYNNITGVKEIVERLKDEVNEEHVRIKDFNKFLLKLFKDKEQFFLFYGHENKTSEEYAIYEKFCSKIKTDCYFEPEKDTKTANLKTHFLHHKDGEKAVYFINNEQTHPSLKYKINNFKNVETLLNFKDKVFRGAWDNFFVSEEPIDPELNAKNPVFIAVAKNYNQTIQAFKGDVILMLLNSVNKQTDMKYLSYLYGVAHLARTKHPRTPILFMAIDVNKNDLPEFANQPTPRYWLYDYLEKKPQRVDIYSDPETTLERLKNICPIFNDPNLEEL